MGNSFSFTMKSSSRRWILFECSLPVDSESASGSELILTGIPVNGNLFLEPNGVSPATQLETASSKDDESNPSLSSEELSSSDHRYTYDLSWIDHTDNAVIATDHLGRVIYYNEVARQKYEYDYEEALGQMVTNWFSHDSCLDFGKELLENLKSGTGWQGPFTMRNKNGDPMPSFVSLNPIVDHNDRVIGTLGVCNSKDADKIDDNETVTSLLERKKCAYSDDYAVVLARLANLSPESTAIWCNEVLLKELGMDSMPAETSLGSLLGLPADCNQTQIIKTPLGKRCYLESIELPSLNLTVIILKDVERRKKLELSLKAATERAESRAFKIDFITTMSHELRTPLHALSGEIENLEEYISVIANRIPDDVRDRFQESIQALRYCYSTQMTLVSNVLDWQKFSSDKLQIAMNPFNLQDTLDEVRRNVRFFAQLRNLTLPMDISKDVPDYIVGDESKVSHILTNLLSNAAKYTHTNTEVCAVVKLVEGQDKILIEVVDHGPGIPDALTHLLFQKFAQLRPKEPDNRGIGLGLNICKQLVELLGGEIGYRDTQGGGSTFCFTFPFQRATNISNGKRKTDVPDKNPLDSTSGKATALALDNITVKRQKMSMDLDVIKRYDSILIVDDNIINLKTLQKMLERLGFTPEQNCTVHIAHDGQECLDMCLMTSYSLILMDMSMPRMDGVQATRILRQRGWNGLIFGATANAMDEHRVTCLDAGMDSFLVKPLTMDKLKCVLLQHSTSSV